ncbi:MAG: PrsW family glutamic-type intramembrane protease [Candidatus Hodarchaeales archaeon]|jgi:hypothetical protein
MRLHLDKTTLLRVISLSSFLLLVILLSLSRLFGQMTTFFWIVSQYCGPLLFLGIWFPFAFSYLIKSSKEMNSISRSLVVMIFGSTVIVLGALMLNTRILFLLLGGILNLFKIQNNEILNQFLILEVTTGLVLPLNEELIKIIPILVISHASILSLSPEDENLRLDGIQPKQTIISRRQFILYGIISGTIFTFLELFLYQWESIEASVDPFSDVFMQITLRTLAPLHILTTVIVALGVYSLKSQVTGLKLRRITRLSSLKFFLLGWGLHALWNSLNVYFVVYLPEMQDILYMILIGFGLIINISLLLIIRRIFRVTPSFCSICGFEGQRHNHQEKIITSQLPIPSRLPVFPPLRVGRKRLVSMYTCPYCYNNIRTEGTCAHCGSRIYQTCPNCNSFISETTTVCQTCNKQIVSLDEINFTSLSLVETWIIGLSIITSLAFTLTPLSILFWLRQEIYLFPITIYLFYFLMGLIIIISAFITLYINRTMGILVLYCHTLNLFFLASISLFGSSVLGLIQSIQLGDYFGGIVLTCVILVLYSLSKRIMTLFYSSYNPIFPEFLNIEDDYSNEGIK